MSDTVARTFHIETALDRKMEEVVYRSAKQWNKTSLVNRAIKELLEKLESVSVNPPLLRPSERKK